MLVALVMGLDVILWDGDMSNRYAHMPPASVGLVNPPAPVHL